MAMTPHEMSMFFARQASKCDANLKVSRIRSTPILLELNMRHAAENIFMSALIDWRHHLADPRDKLRIAFDASKAALEILPALDSPTPLPARFRFYDIVVLATLLRLEIPAGCLSVITTCRTSAGTDLCLDYALAETIAGRHGILGRTIDSAVFSKWQMLLKDTYSTYRDLLAGDKEAIRRAERNFSKRRSDGYFRGGPQIDGGGPDNAHVIDYRLAAILNTVAYETDSIHALS